MKKVAVFNDISGFGKCSLSAALPIISALGVQCCPIPTAVLSNQTGYPSYTCLNLTDGLREYVEKWVELGFCPDVILTGFITDSKQAKTICECIDLLKKDDTLIVVDPVMADNGKLYKSYSLELCHEVSLLSQKANVITPNLTELCLLAQKSYKELTAMNASDDYLDLIAKTARRLLTSTLNTVIVTGIKRGDSICNIIVTRDDASAIKTEYHKGSFSGTGDIFASVISAELAKGMSVTYAVKKASSFIEKGVRDAVINGTDRNDGIEFEKYLGFLLNE